MTLDDIRYYGGSFPLADWTIVQAEGEDCERFFQGQLTNDLSKLEIDQSQLTTRLSRTGQLLAFFYLAKKSDCYYLLIPNVFVEILLEDLDKFIIMDDIEFKTHPKKGLLYLGPEAFQKINDESFRVSFNGEWGIVSLNERSEFELDVISNELMEELRMFHGCPGPNATELSGKLVNESTLNQYAVAYDKGCFLGQETAAKIQNNRGAARYPVLVELESGKIITASLGRDQRVEGKSVTIDGEEGIVRNFPLYKAESFEEKAVELYDRAVELFQNEEEKKAVELLQQAVNLSPKYADAVESLGVIYGRQEKFQLGIDLMDKLLEVDPSSVMAHTNKSLYLMRLGKIEEAEEEKSLATVKSFSRFGEEAKTKKALEEMKKQQEAELLQREGMFAQVLEIDAEDSIANFGMGDISFHRKQYKEATAFLERVIETDPNYSMAYLVLGKSYEALDQVVKAKEIFEKGIEVASKRGDMMPANEMQSRVVKL